MARNVGNAGVPCMGKRNPRQINKFVNQIKEKRDANVLRESKIKEIEKRKERERPQKGFMVERV